MATGYEAFMLDFVPMPVVGRAAGVAAVGGALVAALYVAVLCVVCDEAVLVTVVVYEFA